MIADLIATTAATATTTSLLQNVSVLASITVALLTIGGMVLSLILFVYKVHISSLANAKQIAEMKIEYAQEFEKLRITDQSQGIEFRRLELALVSAGVITPSSMAVIKPGEPS